MATRAAAPTRHRCDAHEVAADAAKGGATARGYDHRWEKVRRAFLRRRPTCDCGRPATEVHHLDGQPKCPRRYAWRNLEALCWLCHRREKNRLQPGGIAPLDAR